MVFVGGVAYSYYYLFTYKTPQILAGFFFGEKSEIVRSEFAQ